MSTAVNENKPSSFYIPDVLYRNRYCNQEDFSILVCGGEDKNKKSYNKVGIFKTAKFEVCDFPFMIKPRNRFLLVNLNNDILAVGGDANQCKELKKSVKSIEIYSNKTKSWQHQYIQVEEKCNYCVCSFMKELFIIGGWIISSDVSLNTCFNYSMKSEKWSQIADLNVERCLAACTVFEGKIVVSGGVNDVDWHYLKSVEAYNFHENKWTNLPDMIEERSFHAAVSMGNKMFVVGGDYTRSC